MVAVPPVDPLTIPAEPTVATDVFELVHVPPDVASLNETVEPWQTTLLPSIDVIGFTLTIAVAVQPVDAV